MATESILYNPWNDAGSDTVDCIPFVAQGRNNWISKILTIAFTDSANKPGFLNQPTAGVKYNFPSNPTIEGKRIRAISLFIKGIAGAVGTSDDIETFPVGSYFYNAASYSQIADWFLCLKMKNQDVVWRNMRLTRLTYITGLQANGLLLEVDIPPGLALSDSYIIKRGSSANPDLSWVLPFTFYYEP